MARDILRMEGNAPLTAGVAPLGAVQPGAISCREIAKAALSRAVIEKRSLRRVIESTPE